MQILCVKNKGYLHFCPLWGFRGGGGLTHITRYPVRRLPFIMDVRMYYNGYVRLTALRRDAMPFFPTLRIGLN